MKTSTNLNIAVCDDNSAVLDAECSLITQTLNEKSIDYNIHTFANAEELLRCGEYFDLIFLDIEMDGITGLDAAAELRRRSIDSLIFFISNHGRYLDDAFNVRAFRFWQKPLDKQKLEYGIDCAVNELKSKNRSLEFKIRSETISIPSRSIIYAEHINRKTFIVTLNGRIQFNMSFSSLNDKLLNLPGFCSIHQSYTVNLRYVTDYTDSEVICGCSGEEYKLYLSRRKRAEFKKQLTDWIGGGI